MNIWVENYVNARSFHPVETTVAIRVFDPGAARKPKDSDGDWTNGPKAPFPSELYQDVWAYTFDDVNYDRYPDEQRLRLLMDPKYYQFTANMADDLVRRFVRAKDSIDALLIHCHAGVSRSVAIANALDEMFELNARWCGGAARFKHLDNDYVGNDFVYRLMCEAAERVL